MPVRCPRFAIPIECTNGVRCLKQGRCLVPIGDGQSRADTSDDGDQADDVIGPNSAGGR